MFSLYQTLLDVLEKGTVVRVELPLERGDIQNEA